MFLTASDERNQPFEPGFPPLEDHRPGVIDQRIVDKDAEGQIRFPHKAKPKDVPNESLATRIARDREGR